MIELKEVLRRHAEGHSLRRIARETGLDRKTVRRYVEATQAVEGSAEERVQHAVREVQVRPPTPPSEARVLLSRHETRIRGWLFPERGQRALRLTKVHTLLRRQGLDVTYTTLWRWAHDALGLLDGPLPWSRMRQGYQLVRLCERYGASRGRRRLCPRLRVRRHRRPAARAPAQA